MTLSSMKALCIAALLSCIAVAVASAAPAVGWRTDGTGKYLTAQPPTTWSPTQNVAWKTAMPSWGNSTPVVVGKRMFLCAEPATLLCVDTADGKILWQKSNTYEDFAPAQAAQIKADQARGQQLQGEVWNLGNNIKKLKTALQDKPDDADLKAKLAAAEQQVGEKSKELDAVRKTGHLLPASHPINGYSSATPLTDGVRVYAVFGNGVAVAYDLYGTRLWARPIEKSVDMWGFSTSPVIADGKLIVHILNVSALDPATGKILWQTRVQEAYGTPAVTKIGDADVIITSAGSIVRAKDGVVLAQNLSRLDFASPVVEGNTVYFIQNGGKALQLPAQIVGDKAEVKALWETKPRNDRYYGSPVVHDGLIYACTQANAFSVIDAATGAVVCEKILPLGKGVCYPSVTMAGGLLYVTNDNGNTVVVKPGREFQQVAASSLEPVRSSLVAIGDALYLRGLQNLYCLRASTTP